MCRQTAARNLPSLFGEKGGFFCQHRVAPADYSVFGRIGSKNSVLSVPSVSGNSSGAAEVEDVDVDDALVEVDDELDDVLL